MPIAFDIHKMMCYTSVKFGIPFDERFDMSSVTVGVSSVIKCDASHRVLFP